MHGQERYSIHTESPSRAITLRRDKSMSTPIQQVRRQGFSQEAFGSLRDRVTNKEDHGPKYVYSPGEPFHRVQERDGVPHVYPGLILGFESYINWHTSY